MVPPLVERVLRLLWAAGRRPWDLALRHPVLLLLFLRVAEAVYGRLLSRRQYLIGRRRVQEKTDDVDVELIQGSLLTCQELVRLGRVEKRTLFVRSMRDVFGSDTYLVSELIKGARKCRQQSSNCLVMRWVPPDERYHVLQVCLNAVSSLFGGNYVHFNALGGEQSELFKSTWYCLTLMTPTRPKEREQLRMFRRVSSNNMETCTFTDMSRTPKATLRIVIANESELRAIADGKLQAPAWGFFNPRHAERYKMLQDFAANFQRQLVSTPYNARGASSRNPFTSERAHRAENSSREGGASASAARARPDGGPMKRVHSQPSMSMLSASANFSGPLSRAMGSDRANTKANDERRNSASASSRDPVEPEPERPEGSGATEDNCFLRLHVPHFVGEKPHQAIVRGPGASGSLLPRQPPVGSPAGLPTTSSHQMLTRTESAESFASEGAAAGSPGARPPLR